MLNHRCLCSISYQATMAQEQKVLSCYLYIVRTYFTPFAYPDCYLVKLWVGTLLFVVDFLTVRFNARSQDFVAQKRLLTEQV